MWSDPLLASPASHATAHVLPTGTGLGSACRPDKFDHLLDAVDAVMPTSNRPLRLRLTTKLSPADMATNGSMWLLYVTYNGTPVTAPGNMNYNQIITGPGNVTYYLWDLVLPRTQINKVRVVCAEVAG